MTQLSDIKRDAILTAATRMFLVEGYSAVSMDAIAEAAPVSKPTLYNYFAGKPALFAAVVAHVCAAMGATVTRLAADGGDLRGDLKAIARVCVDVVYAPDSLRLYRMIMAELKNFPELGQLAYDSGALPLLDGIARYLRGAEGRYGVDFPKVEASTRLFISMLMGDEYHRCLLGIKETLSVRERTHLVNRVVDCFLRAHDVDVPA